MGVYWYVCNCHVGARMQAQADWRRPNYELQMQGAPCGNYAGVHKYVSTYIAQQDKIRPWQLDGSALHLVT